MGVHVGVDGKVRSADVEYKIPSEAKFQVTTRPIHKLVLVVLVEEQTMSKKEVPEEEETHLGGREDPIESAEQAPEKKDGKGSKEQSPTAKGPKGSKMVGRKSPDIDEEETGRNGESPLDKGKVNKGQAAGKKDEEKNLSLEAAKELRKAAIVETPKEGNGKGEPGRIHLVMYQDVAHEMEDIGQAIQRGRGRSWKEKKQVGEDSATKGAQTQPRGVCIMRKQAVAWGLREMGSAWGRGARAGPALQKGGKKSSQCPTKAGTTWGRMRRTNKVGRDEGRTRKYYIKTVNNF